MEDESKSNVGIEATSRPLVMQFFKYAHLPPHLQSVSAPFGELAELIVQKLPLNEERAKALDLLLAAKDAAVRAQLFKWDGGGHV